MDSAHKATTISSVYYDVSGGFGSIGETLRKAKVLDKSITLGDVKAFLDKQEIRQTKKNKRYNSFVPARRWEQIQIDLADFGKPASAFRYGLAAIDSFSKYLSVIPIANNPSRGTVGTLDHVLQQLGIPALSLGVETIDVCLDLEY